MKSLDQIQQENGQWSTQTFPTQNLIGKLHHLKEEVDELLKAPKDPMEYADAFILLLDAARLANISGTGLLMAVERKMAINRTRRWSAPDKNGVQKHIE